MVGRVELAKRLILGILQCGGDWQAAREEKGRYEGQVSSVSCWPWGLPAFPRRATKAGGSRGDKIGVVATSGNLTISDNILII